MNYKFKLASPENKEFEGKVVVITGGSTGIGLACTKSFTTEGAITTVLDIANKPEFLPAAQFKKVDVSDWAKVKETIDSIAKQFGGLNIVINNAGVKEGKSILDVPSEQFEKLLRINGLGYWNVAKASLPYLIKSQGTLINVCSGLSEDLPPNRDAYFSSKGVSISLTYSLANSYKGRVRVLGIAPGPVDTPLWRNGQTEEEIQVSLAGKMGPKVLKPEDLAFMIVSLASKSGTAFNGKIYRYL